MILEYYNLAIFCLLAALIGFFIFIANFTFIFQSNYLEKISPYECGFQPFEDSISTFDIRYYLIAILFLIFDLELIFLLPWVSALSLISLAGFLSMFFFFFLLVVGFYYE